MQLERADMSEDFHEGAWTMLQGDLQKALADHKDGCIRCSPAHVCGFALGINKAYEVVESRLSPIHEPLLP